MPIKYSKYLLIVFCALLGSCAKDKGSSEMIAEGEIISIQAKSNATVNEIIKITVKFKGGTNGCAKPDHLEYSEENKTVSVKAFYNYPSTPQICTANLPTHTLDFNFTPKSTGTFIIKSSAANTAITVQ